ncbi:hypothetical protein, partial [Siminovitchia fortis]
ADKQALSHFLILYLVGGTPVCTSMGKALPLFLFAAIYSVKWHSSFTIKPIVFDKVDVYDIK